MICNGGGCATVCSRFVPFLSDIQSQRRRRRRALYSCLSDDGCEWLPVAL